VTRSSLLLLLCLAAAPALGAPAVSAVQAKAEVTQKVHQVDVYLAARTKLVDERTSLQQRADALAVQVEDAKRNRSVLSDPALKALLRDSLDVGKQLEVSDRKLAMLDRLIVDAQRALEQSAARVGGALPAADRTQLTRDVERLRKQLPQEAHAVQMGVSASAGMDPEALRERADLAGDYEEKLRKEVERTDSRIRELGEQQSVAGEAQLLSQDRRLFDEDDRAVRATRVVQRSTTQAAGDLRAGADPGKNTASEGRETNGAAAPAPPEGLTDAEDGAFGSGGNAPPAATASAGVGVQRSQTVVDERTFALLRESRAPAVAASPAEEMRRLQARKDALIKAAARMKLVREDLNRQSQAARSRAAQ